MKVILLCAGYATRLYPLTENQPKALLPVAARPILNHILERVEAIHQADGVFIVTNHRFAGHFENWGKSQKFPWSIKVIDDQTVSNETRLGAMGDLQFVLKTQGIGAEDLLVIAGDNLFDFDLVYFTQTAEAGRPHAAIAVFDVGDLKLARHYGLVQVDREGKVVEFLEKPENPTTTLVSCGIYWLPGQARDLLDRYLAESHNTDQPGHYMRWLSKTDALYAVPLKGRWYDIGDLTSYQKADVHFRETLKTSERKIGKKP